MARIRTIKPETFYSEDLTALSIPARLTFIGLWTYVDDDGRAKSDPRLIKAALWPLDDNVPASEVSKHLDEMEMHGMVCRYVWGGRGYLHVVNLRKHQKIDRATPSKLPECENRVHGIADTAGIDIPAGQGTLVESSSSPREPSMDSIEPSTFPIPGSMEQGTGNREQGTGSPKSSALARADRDDVERVCKHLADRIEANGSKRPTVTQRWRTEARLLMDADKHSEQQVHAAIDWCQDDTFWRANILSMPTLRDKYEQLRLQASRKPPGSKPSTTDARVADALALANRFEEQGL